MRIHEMGSEYIFSDCRILADHLSGKCTPTPSLGDDRRDDKKAAEAAYSLHVLIVFLNLLLSLLARPQDCGLL
jgi:hypothetical protein